MTTGSTHEHDDRCIHCAVIQEIRVVLASARPPFEKLRAVEIALHRPRVETRPVQLTGDRWPLLTDAWDTHDDPEMNR